MQHAQFPLTITNTEDDMQKASLEYLQNRARQLVRIHSRPFVMDCLQMITSNKLTEEDGGIFIHIGNQKYQLA